MLTNYKYMRKRWKDNYEKLQDEEYLRKSVKSISCNKGLIDLVSDEEGD